jgi:hypothetical protein
MVEGRITLADNGLPYQHLRGKDVAERRASDAFCERQDVETVP